MEIGLRSWLKCSELYCNEPKFFGKCAYDGQDRDKPVRCRKKYWEMMSVLITCANFVTEIKKQTTEKFCPCFYDPAYAYMVVNVPEPWMVLASYCLWWSGNAVSFWGTFLLMSSLWLSWQLTLGCWILTWLLVFCFITKSHNKWECNICLI